MKKQHEKRLDILDSIDDDIIDKQTKKRHDLLTKQRKKPRFVLAMVACLALLVVASSFLILPNFWNDDSKQVPIYQGMSISGEKQTEAADLDKLEYATLSLNSWYANSSRIELLDSDGNNGNNGNHFGQNKKPIEDLAEDSLKVEGAAEKIYYAKPNQDIYITVHVSNPDNFEILSFTLNGKVYSSYMFEDGSDMENLILKYNVGDAEGVVEYTIDAIKYVDGTEIKDVVMEGDKTVQCGVYSEKQPTAEVMSEVVGINKLTLTVNITDPLNLIGLCGGKVAFVLSDGDELIAEQPLTVGKDNTVVFENLLTDTDYEYAIVAIYDSLNGDGIVPIVLYSQVIHTNAVVAFDGVTVTQSGIQFAYVWNDAFENKVLTSAILYKGEEKVQELALDATSLDGLLSDTAYQIVITYENKGKTESVTLAFTTKAKTVPTLSLEKGNVEQESFDFTLTYTDPDSVGAVTKIELLHGEDAPIVAENLDVREFADLLSDNDYTVRVTVIYDLNNGNGEQTFSETLAVKTKAKGVPTVTFSDMKVTKYALTGRYDITDPDGVLFNKTVELYQGETFVKTIQSEGDLSFSDLADYTDYTVKVTYTYDLHDGKGEQSREQSHSIKTLPHVDAKSLAVLNTTALFEGDTIFVQMTVENPHGGKVTAVTVNGKSCAVSGNSTAERLYVEIVDKELTGGEALLTADSITLTLDGKSYTVACETRCSDSVFINGKLEILYFGFADKDYKPCSILVPGEAAYFMLKLSNPTDYEIRSVIHDKDMSISLGEGIRIDSETYVYPVDASELYRRKDGICFTLLEVNYGNEYISDRIRVEEQYYGYVLESAEVRYISSREDLMNMNQGCRYELTCDIDLGGANWSSVPFWGILDGKGYAIRNMTIVGSFTEKENRLGLFKEATGIIENLNMESCVVLATMLDCGATYGAIVADTEGSLIVRNCTVDAASTVSIKASGEIFAGGLVGSSLLYVIPAKGSAIENCINRSSISAIAEGNTTSYVRIGGISGFAALVTGSVNYGNLTFSETGQGSGDYHVGGIAGLVITEEPVNALVDSCANYGDISGDTVGAVMSFGFGGIVGTAKNATIQNCLNGGDVTSRFWTGGIVGSTVGSASLVENCLNLGTISGTHTYQTAGIVADYEAWVGGQYDHEYAWVRGCVNLGQIVNANGGEYRFGIADGAHNVENSYAVELYQSKGKLVSLQTLAEKSFWLDTLGWDEAIWNFDELAPENGKYPTLR